MDIITTIGPSSAKLSTLQLLSRSGANFFRINLSHSDEDSLAQYIDLIESAGLKISLDTQGAQIRLGEIAGVRELSVGDDIGFCGTNKISSQSHFFSINHSELFSQIEPGCKFRIDFDGAVVLIKNVDSQLLCATGTVISAGTIRSNRAIDVVNYPIKLSALTDFDEFSIRRYSSCSEALFISFTNSAEDIFRVREILKDLSLSKENTPKIIAKIESKKGIYNLESILPLVDGVLIDRGDLSREISISHIPIATRSIVQICTKYDKPCYVATNILDSMMTSSLPSRAEVSDLYNLFSLGVSGIVLASEVAIGDNPIDSVRVVQHMSKVYQNSRNSTLPFIPTTKELNTLPSNLAEWL